VKEIDSNIEKIIAGCLKNDRWSQRQLYDRYSSKLYGLCRRYSSSDEEAEDVLMEGFMKVFKSLDSFRHKSSFETWLTSVMLNVAISHFRSSTRFRREIFTEDMDSEEFVEEAEEIRTNLVADQLLELIRKMPEMMRVVFNLKAVDDYSFMEIAGMIGKSENAVRNSYMRGRKWLMDRLKLEKESF
jgi:RNA polymerase sigma-70 factor (ECF subfamily)